MSAVTLVILVAMVVIVVKLLLAALVPMLIVALGVLVVYIVWRLLQRRKGSKTERANEIYTIIKEVDLYEEHLEPAWEYPNPDDQWLFAEAVKEYVGTEYDILYVYDDNTYREVRGLKTVPDAAEDMARYDLSYDDTKRRLKRQGFF